MLQNYTFPITFIGLAALTLPFVYLIQRGSYAFLESIRLKYVYVEVLAVFTPAFVANAVRAYSKISGWGTPLNLLGEYALVGVYLFFPVLDQLFLRRRPLRELGFSRISNWKATMFLWIWLVILTAGSITYRFLTFGRVSFPLLSNAPRITLGLFGEELLFRGFIQTRLETVHGVKRAWIISSLWFGLIHIWNFFVIGLNRMILEMPSIVLVGMILGVAFAKGRSLLTVWPVHVVYDIFTGFRI